MLSRVVTHLRWRRDRLRWHRQVWLVRGADYLTDLGEHRHADWLVYNPLRMWTYHQYARADAEVVADAFMAAFPDARTAADVGSGTGTFAAGLRDRGLAVQACERSRVGTLIGRRLGVKTVRFDLASDPPSAVRGPVDFAYSLEVAEHLPPALGDRLVDFLCTLSPTVVYTAATPGQGGSGHINEQPRSYWTERFARHGYQLDAAASALIANELGRGLEISVWLSKNIMVFRAVG